MARAFYSLVMIYTTILVALLLVFSIARIVYLNTEIRTLELAGEKLQARLESKNDPEAETEHEWATNARDSKKESRTIWLGCAIMSLIALVAAIVELLTNSF